LPDDGRILEMASEPKSKAAGKKKRRRAPREEFVDYVVEITGWDWGYSLSLDTSKDPDDPYHEFRHLRYQAGCCGRPG
jgi:hypothetical protein